MTGLLLALDTATRQVTLALGDLEGRSSVERAWPAGHRHAETLLPGIEEILAAGSAALGDLAAIVVGTGPGGFTGLRVGLATAKTLAHGLGVPIVGVATTTALAAAAFLQRDGQILVVVPSGPSDRYAAQVRIGSDGEAAASQPPRLVPPSELATIVAGAAEAGASVVAVDLEPAGLDTGTPLDAVAAASGAVAIAGLGAALLRIGAQALAAGRVDAVDELVPTYVTLPRGLIAAGHGDVPWSPDLR